MAINLTGLNPLRHLSCVSAAQALSVVNPNWHHSAQGLLFFLPLFICPFSSTVSHRRKQILGYSPKRSLSEIFADGHSQTLPLRSRCPLPSLPYFVFIISVMPFKSKWAKTKRHMLSGFPGTSVTLPEQLLPKSICENRSSFMAGFNHIRKLW